MIRIIMSGLISGLVMAAFLRTVESFTGIKVYTLLLNVDYIPIAREATGIEWLELSMHMVVAIAVAWFVQTWIIKRTKQYMTAISFTILFSLIIGLLLFPSTILSERTPLLDDGAAWFWWLISHFIYGWILAILLRKEVE